MTQSNLLECAKQGDSEAIAALMNLTLMPKGITATAELDQHCLHVLLISSRGLNQTTMVAFVRKGLLDLGSGVIQSAKVYGRKAGDDAPVWSEEFAIVPCVSDQYVFDQYVSDQHGSDQPSEQSVVDRSITDPAITTSSIAHPSGNHRQSHPPAKWFLAITDNLGRAQSAPIALGYKLTQLGDRLQDLEISARQLASQAQTLWVNYLNESKQKAAQVQLPQRILPTTLRPPRLSPAKYMLTLAIATLPAFLLGAVVAVITAYAGNSEDHPPEAASAPSVVGNQITLKPGASIDVSTQQAEVRKYLTKMNRAQQDFYQKNNRFASNLEELERSAAIISLLSQTPDYVYKLTLIQGHQSQLTAIPRLQGFKSFTGMVVLNETGTASKSVLSTICESDQPSQHPLQVTKSADKSLQCPIESVQPS